MPYPYSYSAIKMYEECPSKYKFSRILRLPQPSGPAAERGTMIHAEIENAIKGGLDLLSDEIMHLANSIKVWKENGAQSEMKFSIDKHWNAIPYDDPMSMFRGVIDLYLEHEDKAVVIDFKTGKDRDYSDQIRVYSAVILATKPHISEVKNIIEFIDLKKTKEYPTIKREDLSSLKSLMVGRILAPEKDNIFAPNPNQFCKWCHYRKDNGGPCKW
jgi:CRISPR/Cas system-associated exonuclease Cas4 (RecB family)